MNKDLLLKELDILKTYFEEMIDGASEDDDAGLDTMFMLNNLKGYVDDAIKYVNKGETMLECDNCRAKIKPTPDFHCPNCGEKIGD